MSSRERIQDAAEREVCPQCGAPLGRERIGSGRFADGVFCGLDCFAVFHEHYFAERIQYGLPSQN